MNKKDFGIRPSFSLVLDCLKFGESGVLSVVGKSAADQAISIERRNESGEIIELELSFSEASRLHNVLSTAINRIKSGKYDFIESGLLLVEDQEDQSNIYKAAFYICKHHDDAEDIAQEAFLAYFKADQDFESEEHIKAWLLRVTINKAKNLKTSFWHREKVSVPNFTEWLASRNEESEEGISETSEDLLRAVMELPEKCRIVVHLFYYEGYSIKEIAKIVEKKENTVKAHLYRGREILRGKLKEEW